MKVLKQVHDENTVFIDKLKPEDNLARLREIFAAIEEQKADKIKIGRLLGKSETAVGDFGEQMVKEIKNLITPDKFSEVSLDHVIARLMSVHDETAIVSEMALEYAKRALVLTKNSTISTSSTNFSSTCRNR